MGWRRIAFSGLLLSALAGAQTLNCEFQGYKALDGLKAEMRSGSLELTWQGERGQTLRATLGVDGGQPVVRELAVEKNGKWSVLGHNLTPEYQVTTGRRRISAQQEAPLRATGHVHTRSHRTSEMVRVLGRPAEHPRASRWQRGRRSAAQTRRGPARLGSVSNHRLPGGYRWRPPGSQLPRRRARHLLRRLALHRLPRHQPASPGGDCQDRRALRGLQVRSPA